MSNLYGGIPSIEDLMLSCDTSKHPLAGEVVPCLMCAKPLLMRPYSGVPDQICPECTNLYMSIVS